jgi:hypothetical protein
MLQILSSDLIVEQIHLSQSLDGLLQCQRTVFRWPCLLGSIAGLSRSYFENPYRFEVLGGFDLQGLLGIEHAILL